MFYAKNNFISLKRTFDIVAALITISIMTIPFVVIILLIRLTSSESALYWSSRVGKDNKIFLMPKFRTMSSNVPDLATHLLKDPGSYITPFGSFLRRTSLDELPQLWSILKGDMSFVGPRPALFNQDDLIEQRTARGVHKLVPGVTGLAQVNGRDGLTIAEKVDYDAEYMQTKTFFSDLIIIYRTFVTVLKRTGISH